LKQFRKNPKKPENQFGLVFIMDWIRNKIAKAPESQWFGWSNIFNLIIGTGALTLPKAFLDAGWVLSTIEMTAMAFMSYLTCTFVVESMANANALLKNPELMSNSYQIESRPTDQGQNQPEGLTEGPTDGLPEGPPKDLPNEKGSNTAGNDLNDSHGRKGSAEEDLNEASRKDSNFGSNNTNAAAGYDPNGASRKNSNFDHNNTNAAGYDTNAAPRKDSNFDHDNTNATAGYDTNAAPRKDSNFDHDNTNAAAGYDPNAVPRKDSNFDHKNTNATGDNSNDTLESEDTFEDDDTKSLLPELKSKSKPQTQPSNINSDSAFGSEDQTKDFEITEQVEMAKMASLFFGKWGLLAFYVCLAAYLMGDLAIYSLAVTKSFMSEMFINFTSCDNTTNLSKNISDSEKCLESWPHWNHQTIYGLCIVSFFIGQGILVLLLDVTKNKIVQIGTSMYRFAAFIAMISMAFSRRGGQTFTPSRGEISGVPNLITASIYSFMCHHSLPNILTPIKGQLISEENFGVFKSPKK
jgi:hypothetical protein